MADTSHDAYLRRAHFPELDGLRGLCALLVITVHLYSHKAAWAWLAGDRAVTLFFALSGLLITTLALREEGRDGRLALGPFFIRRAFRLFPLYYFVLAVYIAYVLVLGRGDADQQASLSEALAWYALYFQEVPFFDLIVRQQRDLPFFHSWSLGVEEKFYLLWPPLAFVLWRCRPALRLRGTVALVAALTLGLPILAWVGFQQWARYLSSYQAILAGCLLAQWLHDADAFERLGRLARGWTAFIALIALHALSSLHGLISIVVSVLYPLAALVVLAGLMRGEGALSAFFRWGPLVAVGKLSYGVYLVHLLAMALVYKVFAVGSWSVVGSVLAYLVVAGVSVAVAAVLHVVIEAPMIRLGRWLATPAPLESPRRGVIMEASPQEAAAAC